MQITPLLSEEGTSGKTQRTCFSSRGWLQGVALSWRRTVLTLKINIFMDQDQLTLGVGTRLQHTQHGPGVIVAVKYATYLISFINHGVKEIDKKDTHLDEIIPENVTAELETTSAVEKSLLKILRLWSDTQEI